MAMTDPVADFLTRIRNANRVYKTHVDIPSSRLKVRMSEILKLEGYIKDYKLVEEETKKPVLRVYLKYTPNRIRVLNGLKRISKPGLRVHVGKEAIPKVLGGLGLAIMSTSRGVLTDKESRSLGIGGEVLCYVW